MCDKRDMVITCVFRYDLYFPLMLSGLLQIRSVKKRLRFAGKFFKIKLLSRLSHEVCRLLPLPFCFVSSLIYLKSFNKLEDFGESLPFYTFF